MDSINLNIWFFFIKKMIRSSLYKGFLFWNIVSAILYFTPANHLIVNYFELTSYCFGFALIYLIKYKNNERFYKTYNIRKKNLLIIKLSIGITILSLQILFFSIINLILVAL